MKNAMERMERKGRRPGKKRRRFLGLGAIFLALCVLLSQALVFAAEIDYGALSDEELEVVIREAIRERDSRKQVHIPMTTNPSPDKYTWYLQDYVGRNAASFGYTSLGGDRLESYGAGHLAFVFVTEDGSYLDYDDEEELSRYIVTGQNMPPNTEMKYEFTKNSKGEEYSNLLDHQSLHTLDVSVRRIDGRMAGDPVFFELIPQKTSLDRHTEYIRNYVGKNLGAVGYTSLGGERRDVYGAATVRLSLVAEDGTFLDPQDEELLRQYLVIAQDVAPNAEMRLVFATNSKGEEYASLINSQTFESITLYARRLNLVPLEEEGETEEKVGERLEERQEDPEVKEEREEEEEQEAKQEEKKTAAKAQDQTGTEMTYRNLRYRVGTDGNMEICGYVTGEKSFTIPSEIDGREVTGIAEEAFAHLENLESLHIWADLEYFGDRAFMGCTSLKEISIPGETTLIGESAFEDCHNLKTVHCWGDPVRIEKNTFKNCYRLKEFSVASSVTSIEEGAFENCERLSSVHIWGDITEIGKRAFKGCKRLKQVSIPSSCQVIMESAFEGCEELDKVYLWGDTNIGESAFRGCTSLEQMSFSSGTEYIGDYAFEGCTELENVYFWGDSTAIGKDAFANCPKLDLH